VKKRIPIIFVIIICCAVCILPVSAAEGLANFKAVNTYTPGQFKDVPPDVWYSVNVEIGYKLGIISGKSDTTYEPNSNLKLSEAVKLAACLHSIYYTGKADFQNGSPWYQTYVDYALANGILKTSEYDFDTYAARYQFAEIFANSMPEEALPEINRVDDNAITDVPIGSSYGAAVYKLYRAGILTGSGTDGTFMPNQYITRSEVAAIVSRMADKGLRKYVSLKYELSAESIYEKCSPSVFFIMVYDAGGRPIATGSGFFISSSGDAVTNYHVIKNASSAVIKISSGEEYNVLGITGFNKENDLALLKIDGDGFSYLEIGDASVSSTGATIYAIGSPLGFSNTISEGIISSSARLIDGINYIQITAPISPGSSGGALLNKQGQVIGVTAASIVDGQNLNLAVPINLINDIAQSNIIPLSELVSTGQPAGRPSDKTIAVDSNYVELYEGSSETILVMTTNMDDDDYLVISYDSDYIDPVWNDWIDYDTTSVTLYGIKAGTNDVKISIVDGDDTVITSVFVTVVVNKSVTTGGYPDNPAVPDFGAYFGLRPFYKEISEGEGYYVYSVDELYGSYANQAFIEDYISILKDWGFFYSFTYTSDDGTPVIIYENIYAGKAVGISISVFDGDAYFLIIIINS
jgi:S1-C subfamily serine protease